MKTLVVNNAERYMKDFTDPIVYKLNRMGASYDVIQWADLPFADMEDYERIILSASPMGNDIVENHLPAYEWIKPFEKPIFGICAGHQIMGKLYGADIIRGKEKEDGLGNIHIDIFDPIFNGYGYNIPVIQHHNDSITVPEDFEKIAHSERCNNQAMKHKTLPIVTVQFHAEELNQSMIENFCKFYR